MNSVERGNLFEEKVANMIRKLIDDNQLPVNGKYSKVYTKKGYYSQQRKADIVIDISVECTLPGETHPSIFLMIECKDYSKPVPVNDIEEFSSKLDQITGLNVKGMFVTSTNMQSGTLNYAISKGIRVMRIWPDNKTEILSFRKEKTGINPNSRDYVNVFLALTSLETPTFNFRQVGMSPGKLYFKFSDMLMDVLMD